jgi:hypothetical protein
MTHPPGDIADMHAALYSECGLPALGLTMSDTLVWRDFLSAMAPLAGTERGPLTVADIRAVIRLMRRQRDRNGIPWSLRPSRILRDPETFRDIVLETRQTRRQPVQQPPAIQRLPGGGQRILDQPAAQAEQETIRVETLAALRELRAKLGHSTEP